MACAGTKGDPLAIRGFSKTEFGEELARVLSPAHPVRTLERLHGRVNELEAIERALFQPGRHIFIHGDRGVGKSSLGATAALQYQSSDASPIFVGGSCDDTFRSIIANIANQAMARSRLETIKRTASTGFEWRGIKFSSGLEVSTRDVVSQIENVSDAADLLREVAARHSEKPVVVIDEFDAINSIDERNKFASLLKQLGDQQIEIRFIFTGVGSSLDELLGAHQSAHRQLDCVSLGKLPWEGRREIVQQAMQSFGVDIVDELNWRIAMVSDGYPYYVHLITEKILWEVFADDDDIELVTSKHYMLGLNAAVRSVNAELRRPYEKAVLHREPEYEDVVWSTADTDDLLRSSASMRQSYEYVVSKRQGRELLDAKAYGECLRKLRTPAFGEILVPLEKRRGWYGYRENMLRGFVRMQAEANGLRLNSSLHTPKQHMHVTVNARSGSYGPAIPRGVDINRRLRDHVEDE